MGAAGQSGLRLHAVSAIDRIQLLKRFESLEYRALGSRSRIHDLRRSRWTIRSKENLRLRFANRNAREARQPRNLLRSAKRQHAANHVCVFAQRSYRIDERRQSRLTGTAVGV